EASSRATVSMSRRMPNYDIGVNAYPIIIVENDADLCILLRYVVAQTYPEASIALASTSHAALQSYASHGAQLVIIDHLLPWVDGIILAHHLRARQADL